MGKQSINVDLNIFKKIVPKKFSTNLSEFSNEKSLTLFEDLFKAHS